jgi:hypothetical protein
MFHWAFRDSTKRIGFSEFGGPIAYPFLLAPHDSECACACNNILRDCFPGNGRHEPLHFEIERSGENVGRIKAGPFRDVIYGTRVVGTP